MNVLEFVSSLIGHLAWPIGLIVLVTLLRRPLSAMLKDGPVKLLRAGPSGFVIEYFDRTLKEASDELESDPDIVGYPTEVDLDHLDFMSEMERLATISPSAVVLESFARLERALRTAIMKQSDDRSKVRTSARSLATEARKLQLLEAGELTAFDDLNVLRNVVAHSSADDLSVERSLNYAQIAYQLISSIQRDQG